MDDVPGAALDHAGNQGPVEPCGGEDVDVHHQLPDVVALLEERHMLLAVRAHGVDEDVDAAEPVVDMLSDCLDARGRADVGPDEQLGCRGRCPVRRHLPPTSRQS